MIKQTRKKPNYSSPRYSRKFNRISKPNSLRSKVFKFMNSYPLASFQQMFNFLLPDYKYQITDVDDFNNVLYVYRCQYIQIHGKRAIPDKKQLEAIRKGYDIPFYSKNEFKPDPEVVATKEIKDKEDYVKNINETAQALRNLRF